MWAPGVALMQTANAAYGRRRRNETVTEIVKIPNRGHSLTIASGWREVAQTALRFVQRFAWRRARRRSTLPGATARRRAAVNVKDDVARVRRPTSTPLSAVNVGRDVARPPGRR